MQRKPTRHGATKWCHVVWPTYRRVQLCKIPEAARFCERTIRARSRGSGWRIESVLLAPNRVHVLVCAPATASRKAIIRRVQALTTRVVRDAGMVARSGGKLWDGWAWCSVLSNGPAVLAVRRWLAAQKRQ